MKFMDIFKSEAWKQSLHGAGMKLNEAKPEIFLITGGISMLAGTIYACVQTEKAKKAVADAKNKEKEEGIGNLVNLEDQSPEQVKARKTEEGKKLVKIYGNLAYKMLKIYGIPAILWFGGMGLVCSGHHILRQTNAGLIADSILAKKLFDEYRDRVAKAVGEEAEKKIYMGAQEGTIKILEKNPKTGEEKLVEKKADVFQAQPGSIYAVNFTEETSDAFDTFTYAERTFDKRVDEINKKLEIGVYRAFSGMEIYRMLGFNENALGFGNGPDVEERLKRLVRDGISGNAQKVPDPEMRKLKVTKLRGYQKRWDAVHQTDVYIPCTRYDFNFYPLEGKI